MKIINIENVSVKPNERKVKKLKKFTEDIISSTKISTALTKEKTTGQKIYTPINSDKFEHHKELEQKTLNHIEK